MHFDIQYGNDAEVDRVIIKPDDHEDPDTLHNYSKVLQVCNPVIQFVQQAKAGKFDAYNNEDYDILLASIKEFDKLFFRKAARVNVFRLLADMTEYIFQNCYFKLREDEEEEAELDEDEPPFD